MRYSTLNQLSLVPFLILFLALLPTTASDNYTIVSGPRNFVPPWYSPIMKPSETKKYLLQKGNKQLLFLKLTLGNTENFDETDDAQRNKSYVSAFGVDIDNYAQLTIPNSYTLLADAESGNNELYVEMIHFVPKTISAFGFSAAQETKQWITSQKKMTKKTVNRGFFFVYNRTLLVRADKGSIIGFDWAPTTCVADPTSEPVDGICAYGCSNCMANITVSPSRHLTNDVSHGKNDKIMVAYTGTDLNGEPLSSYTKDIWRLKNAFTV